MPYPAESVRSVTLVAEAGKLFLDVTAEVEVAEKDLDSSGTPAPTSASSTPTRWRSSTTPCLCRGGPIRAEERLHLEDIKRRGQKAAAKAPSKV